MEDIKDVDYEQSKDFVKILKKKKKIENIMISKFKAIHCCWQMYVRTLEICVFKYMSLTLQNFFKFLD